MYKTIITTALLFIGTHSHASDYTPRYTDTPYCKWDYDKKATLCYNRGKKVSEQASDNRKDVSVEIKNKTYVCDKNSGACKQSTEKSKH